MSNISLIFDTYLIPFTPNKANCTLICIYVEEGPEHNNRNLRQNIEHFSRQNSLQNGLLDIFLRSTYASDPNILKIIQESLPKKPDKRISPQVQELLDNPSDISDSNSDSD